MGSDMGALRGQTAFNIRERAGRRKQKPVRRPESPLQQHQRQPQREEKADAMITLTKPT